MKAVNVLDQRVGERLRSWRLKMGLSQSELSAAGRNAAPLTGQGQGKRTVDRGGAATGWSPERSGPGTEA
jgi:hypothetical protein